MRMSRWLLASSLTLALLGAAPVVASEVVVKGPHICCGACVKAVDAILAKVQGVSEAKADQATKSVTFTAKDDAAAKAGVKALFNGGFYGAATHDGKELKIAVPTPKKGEKADVVVVKDVHMCCGQCINAAKKIFADSKVTVEGKGAQRTVRIEGTDLDRAAVIETLRKAGFNGTLEK